MENSVYLSKDLEGRLELARYAYNVMDENRHYGDWDMRCGYYGDQFCRFLSDWIGEMTCVDFTKEECFQASTEAYEVAEKYYPDLVILLDGGELK